jgi:lambda repressor-like predicted transcriptional regulator
MNIFVQQLVKTMSKPWQKLEVIVSKLIQILG